MVETMVPDMVTKENNILNGGLIIIVVCGLGLLWLMATLS